MTAILRQGEVVKLARTFGRSVDDLAFVHALDAPQLRALREALSARLFDDVRPVLARVASGARLLPVSLVARVGANVFGSMLCARVAGLLAPPHALEIALKMPDAFLAEVSAAIDPRSAGEVVAAIPAPRIVAVAHILLAKRDFVTLARFVDHLSPETIKSVIDSIPDELELLRIAAYVESRTKLAELVGQLEDHRVRAMFAALRDADADMWREGLAVAEMLDDDWRRTIGDLVASLDAQVLVALVDAAGRFDVWFAALPFVLAMSEASQRHFLALPVMHDRAVLVKLVAAAEAIDAWDQLAPFVDRVPDSLRELLLEVLDTVEGGSGVRTVHAALSHRVPAPDRLR